MNYLSELNEPQRAAVQHTAGPCMIIAGPGSGKTRVLTYRIAYLMQQGVDPFNILSLTFTNKAAAEMRHRIESVVGPEARSVFMGTFHSVFARILRTEAHLIGYPSSFSIYDMDDAKNLIKLLVKEMALNDKMYKPNIVLYRISSAKNSLITPQAYLANPELMSEDESNGRPRIGDIYQAYASRCFQSGAMDFDDLIFKMYELLNRLPEVLHKYQHKFRHLLVDEFQDTNYAQYEVIKLLTDVFKNISVVGDDAQSIYAFRGATLENMLNFKKDYPQLSIYKLEQNYRSTDYIVQAANALIKNNQLQLPKQIWTSNQQGNKIKLLKGATDNEEARKVVNTLYDQQMRHQWRPNDFAILYRTNAQSRALEEQLRKMGIPYLIYGGISFYQRREVKNLLGYLKLAVNHNDEDALRRIINYPTRGIGKTTIERITVIAHEQQMSLWNVMEHIQSFEFSARVKGLISDFVTMIKSFATMASDLNAYDLAMHIGKSTNMLSELYLDKTVEGISRYENIQALLNGIKEFVEKDTIEEGEEIETMDKTLGTYLQDIMLLTSQDKDNENKDAVKLMTIHSAKGLEFRSVFVVGMEERLFPSFMSLYSREDLEEERRLFYVAITRAEQQLTISYATSRFTHGKLNYAEPSRFIEELPEEYIIEAGKKKPAPAIGNSPQYKSQLTRQIKVVQNSNASQPVSSEPFVAADPNELVAGMAIEHQRFGQGKLVDIVGSGPNRIAKIQFNVAGEKKIMLKFAKLKIL